MDTGASSLQPRSIFVRPILDSESNEISLFLTIFPQFLAENDPNYVGKNKTAAQGPTWAGRPFYSTS
jgi:hypothetical protein